MGYVKKQRAEAQRTYQATLKQIDAMIPVVDAAHKLAAYWTELTGEDVKAFGTTGHAYLYIHMGTLMPNGRYPTRSKELALMIERADELLAGHIPFDKYKHETDKYNTTLRWGEYGKLFVIYAYNGGNCTYKKVGTRMVEEPIFEMECK